MQHLEPNTLKCTPLPHAANHTSRSASLGVVVHFKVKSPGTLLAAPGTWMLRLPLASEARVNVVTFCWAGSYRSHTTCSTDGGLLSSSGVSRQERMLAAAAGVWSPNASCMQKHMQPWNLVAAAASWCNPPCTLRLVPCGILRYTVVAQPTHLGIGVDRFVGPLSVIGINVIVRLAHEGGHAVKGNRSLKVQGRSEDLHAGGASMFR